MEERSVNMGARGALLFITDPGRRELVSRRLRASGFAVRIISDFPQFASALSEKVELVVGEVHGNLTSWPHGLSVFTVPGDEPRRQQRLRDSGATFILPFAFDEPTLIHTIDQCVALCDDPLLELMSVLKATTGVQLGPDKRALVETRLQRRLHALGLPDFKAYVAYFRSHRATELPAAVSLITTHTTEFFREEDHFDRLHDQIFAQILANRKKITIWSAACSTGQEAYSLAIALLEFLELTGRQVDIRILGTDIDEACVRTARQGVYRRDLLRGINARLIEKYFDHGTGELKDFVRIKDTVHRLCRFEQINLLKDDPPETEVDLIFLRNVLIYFSPADIAQLARGLAKILNPHGFLFLGHSESFTGMETPFRSLGNSIYVPKGDLARGDNRSSSLILVGASTGGVEALRVFLEAMPKDCPPILIVQHIPKTFSGALAKRLNETCQIRVSEAMNGEFPERGHAYIAPGEKQMRLSGSGSNWFIEITNDPPLGLHKPSVDYLFQSAVPLGRQLKLIAVLMTGMGKDGAEGLKALKSAGAHTIAQDEKTSVVFGMPGSAISLGAASEILPLNKIADGVQRAYQLKSAA